MLRGMRWSVPGNLKPIDSSSADFEFKYILLSTGFAQSLLQKYIYEVQSLEMAAGSSDLFDFIVVGGP